MKFAQTIENAAQAFAAFHERSTAEALGGNLSDVIRLPSE
jgi:hypothetical protein